MWNNLSLAPHSHALQTTDNLCLILAVKTELQKGFSAALIPSSLKEIVSFLWSLLYSGRQQSWRPYLLRSQGEYINQRGVRWPFVNAEPSPSHRIQKRKTAMQAQNRPSKYKLDELQACED